ncbi:immunoglobulin-like domain-containing receptor 2 isoform X1 [Trematomus bernacchii]|uniref:immunoglobulin-like domain-containing receptor 2 isoform X1 n=1 Tax=Trematomus bernacchii TaxID=40690 RepID=UPI00146A7474|nr:immunoglobulin-like domain-containing receptor 2 isoform X1 [Trematomus bernacchii]
MNFYRLAFLLGALVCVCDGVHVTVREKQRFAMLFQSVVLPCQYQTASNQHPVVQWWYKSYCRDRTRDSFTLPEKLGVQGSELGPSSHLECSDSGRTVRVVASAQGASMTLAEHYKGRDIAIVNKADLRIGELQWGDSGVYYCKVVIADDLEGKNEAQLELLVLGRTGQKDDILPEFDVEIMPEWVFVGSVVLGSVLFLLLMGICWCQCCPHSCCCYVSCCCCPETCCCPRHLYEAGKMAKSGPPPPQVPVYPYYIPGVPTVVPLAPPSHVEPQMASIPSVENNLAGARSGYRLKASPHQDSMKVLYYVEKELGQFPSAKMAAHKPSSLSELSSLHDGGTSDFRHTYQTVQMKALPPIADLDGQSLRAPAHTHTHNRRMRRDRRNLSDDELDRRWNPPSEHLQRKTLSRRGRTGSLDELEDFAQSYNPRSRPERGYEHDYSPPRRFYREEDEGWGRRSPSPLSQKRRDTWDSDRPCPPPKNKGYDDTLLSSVLDSKARGRGGDRGDRGAYRADEDSDTPSKGSSRGKGSFYSRSPSNRPEEEDTLPPYSEREAERYRRADPNADRYRTVEPPRAERYKPSEPNMRPFCYTRPPQDTSQTQREERERSRNLSTALSRDTLIV